MLNNLQNIFTIHIHQELFLFKVTRQHIEGAFKVYGCMIFYLMVWVFKKLEPTTNQFIDHNILGFVVGD